jgi:hypothetical protein
MFVTPSLLLGLAVIAVPVVLHLVMRQKPKRLVFPALQFVKQRRETNTRRLQFRHLLLLLLRCLAIAAVLAALARPRVPSPIAGNVILLSLGGLVVLLVGLVALAASIERKPLWISAGLGSVATLLLALLAFLGFATFQAGAKTQVGSRTDPVAAVLVFDTSPRMLYQRENKSRLAEAQETADWVLDQLPPGSKVAVVDATGVEAVFAQDEAAASEAVERLEVTFIPRPLAEVIDAGLQRAIEQPELRKEVYVFSDLTVPSWTGKTELLKQRLADHPEVPVYLIDVGVERPRNFALREIGLPGGASLARNGTLEVETVVDAIGGAGERTVELYLEQPDVTLPRLVDDQLKLPQPQLRGQKGVQVEAGSSTSVPFRVAAPTEEGVHQGYVRITGGADALAVDDVRYFTVEVKTAWPVLVVSPRDVDPSNLVEAIAPYAQRVSGKALYQCTEVDQNNLGRKQLAEYRVVCLLDPEPLPAEQWRRLADFVEQGGSLAVFLGPNARQRDSFNSPEAQALLPGKLVREFRSSLGDSYLSPRSLDHPVMAVFRSISTRVPWNEFPVYLHWQLEVMPSAQTVLTYADGEPAVLETNLSSGRVLTMTTPITEPLRPSGRTPWNELTSGSEPWPYFVLINEMLKYLVGSGDEKINYQVGETAVLPNRLGRDPETYQLWPPGRDVQPLPAADAQVQFSGLTAPGAYRLKGATVDGPVVRGFSANLPKEAGNLQRVERKRLDEVLGEGRYSVARDRKQIDLSTRESRQGWEFYPLLLVLSALLLGMEYLLANRFYRRREATT